MQFVFGDRILDGVRQVMWRGAGGSYLMHSDTDYLTGWTNYLPNAKYMGLDTFRLAFKFAWETSTATADILDIPKMDEVVAFLAANGVKSILDYHGSAPWGPQLTQAWKDIAAHYKGNSDVAAYEVYNEPSQIGTPQQNAQGYHDITQLIREVDPDHICIWETPAYYVPPFETIQDLLLPNVVYTSHRWWTNNERQIEIYGPVELSRVVIGALLTWRGKFKIPIWLGEFGGPGGGNANLYTPTDPSWRICEELLYRCEEQVVPWNLWMGVMTTTNNRLGAYKPLFPLKVFNSNLIRHLWPYPPLTEYISTSKGLDKLSDYSLEMWHGGDSVTFKPGIKVKTISVHLFPDNTFEKFEETKSITAETTIMNEEGTTTHPGDWNTIIISNGYTQTLLVPTVVREILNRLPIRIRRANL